MAEEFIRVTVVLEFPVDQSLYPESRTPGERAEVERENHRDPKILMGTAEQYGVKSVSAGSFTIQ